MVSPEPRESASTAYAPPPRPVIITPQPPRSEFVLTELECLAKTIYFEARGESEEGQRAVGAVVLNRVKSRNFPNTICEVVHQGGTETRDCQFSWWCDGRSDRPKDREAWEQAVTIAYEVMTGAPDPTKGALYYHNASVSPSWRTQLRRLATIGEHVYYR